MFKIHNILKMRLQRHMLIKLLVVTKIQIFNQNLEKLKLKLLMFRVKQFLQIMKLIQ